MKKFLFALSAFIVILLTGCKVAEVAPNEEIEIIQHFSQLEEMLDTHKDKLVVLNFWATTCPPCIKEMPHFKDLENKYKSGEVKVLLVNLDRERDFEKRVLPFIEKHQIVTEVLMLADENYSAWTDKIDSTWYGALPATLISKDGERKFRFGLYEAYQDLENDVKEVMGH